MLLTRESGGYYADFGEVKQLAKAWEEGYVYSGEYSVYRKRRHGNSSGDRPARQFIVFSQNHDQVGNRMFGERLSGLVSFESLKLAAGTVMLSPFIPLLFMGEEYGEKSPFLYFMSHTDPDLIESVRNGRKEEFCDFNWHKEPPDPFDEETFLRSKIHWEERESGEHRILLEFYKELIRLRTTHDSFICGEKDRIRASDNEKQRLLSVTLTGKSGRLYLLFNFDKEDQELITEISQGRWARGLASAEERWGGPGALIPPEIHAGETIKINKESFAVFLSCEEEH